MTSSQQTTPESVHVIGGGLAGSEAAWQLAQLGVPVMLHEMRPVRDDRRPQDRPLGRAGLLQLVPLRRPGTQCGRAAACRDAPPRLAGDARGRRQPGAGRRRAGGRPRGLCRRRHRGASGASADHPRARRSRAAAGRLGQRHHRHRPAHLAGAGRAASASLPAKSNSPSSTPSRRSCIATRSISIRPGSSRATTRPAPAAPAPTTSIARSRANSTTPSSTR